MLDGQAPAELLASAAAYVNCVAGAVSKSEYLAAMAASGLTDITIHLERDARELLNGCCAPGHGERGCCSNGDQRMPDLPEGLVKSITVSGRRPG